jgi:hypothetical protein
MSQLTLQEKMFALAADHALFEQAKANAFNYLDSAFERSLYPTDAALAGLAVFDELLPAAGQLKAEGFQVLNEVVFNQVLVTGNTPDETGALLIRLQQSGDIWCGGANWQGRPVIRISVCSWATTEKDIDRLTAAFVDARKEI